MNREFLIVRMIATLQGKIIYCIPFKNATQLDKCAYSVVS